MPRSLPKYWPAVIRGLGGSIASSALSDLASSRLSYPSEKRHRTGLTGWPSCGDAPDVRCPTERSACGTACGPTQPTAICSGAAAFNGVQFTPLARSATRATFTDVAVPRPRSNSGHPASKLGPDGSIPRQKKGHYPAWTAGTRLARAMARRPDSNFPGRPVRRTRTGYELVRLLGSSPARRGLRFTCSCGRTGHQWNLRSSQGAQRRRDNPRRLTATRSHASDQPGCPARHRGTERWVSRAGPSSGAAGSADRQTGA